jgi:hypothetical protein
VRPKVHTKPDFRICTTVAKPVLANAACNGFFISNDTNCFKIYRGFLLELHPETRILTLNNSWKRAENNGGTNEESSHFWHIDRIHVPYARRAARTGA